MSQGGGGGGGTGWITSWAVRGAGRIVQTRGTSWEYEVLGGRTRAWNAKPLSGESSRAEAVQNPIPI